MWKAVMPHTAMGTFMVKGRRGDGREANNTTYIAFCKEQFLIITRAICAYKLHPQYSKENPKPPNHN